MNSPLRVLFRADASARMGLGHAQRCLVLAAALQKRGVSSRLLTRDLGFDLTLRARASGIDLQTLPAPEAHAFDDTVPHAAWAEVPWERDADDTIGAASSWRPDWVIVDHYAFDARWHERVARASGSRIGVIDDLADRTLAANFLLDQNPHPDHREKYRGYLPSQATLLGGPRYALLAEPYAAAKPVAILPEVRSIGIFMGGSDAQDHSSLAVRACRDEAGFTGHIEVAITSAHPRQRELKELASRSDTRVSIDLPDLVEFHGRHDLQIGAGGGATWERCCFGVPTLGIVLARNQSVTLPALAEQGAIALYAPAGPAEARGLGKALVPLLADAPRRRAMAERSRQVCDGQGARRVALKLAASTLALRAATVADARRMFDWRNHEETRAVSGNAEKIPWPAHTAWLDRVLADAQRHLFVAEIGGDAVGVIRFDVDADQQAEVSLYLDPSLTGLGLGPRLLAAGETLMNTRQVAAFRARVLGGNDRSRQMFERSGYRFEGEAGHKPGARTIHEVH